MLTGGRRRNVSLIRLPRPADPDEYESASREIEDLLGDLPGLVAVYRTGKVSIPGISDLDRIAVIERGTQVESIWPKLSNKSRYLAMHGPFLVDRATFRRHRWFAYLEPLELSFGTGVELEDRPIPAYSESLLGVESMVVSLLSTIKQLSTGIFKVRPSLCQLHNLRHALSLTRLGRSDAPAAWALADDVSNLRDDWFTSPDHDRAGRARDVAVRAPGGLLEALRAVGQSIENSDGPTLEMKLGETWSNVVLTSAGTGGQVVGTPRLRVPFVRSARAAELAWRLARPRIALHPAALALLAGRGGEEERGFRSTRDELVRAHRDFIAEAGGSYSGIGLASPFLSR